MTRMSGVRGSILSTAIYRNAAVRDEQLTSVDRQKTVKDETDQHC